MYIIWWMVYGLVEDGIWVGGLYMDWSIPKVFPSFLFIYLEQWNKKDNILER